MFQEDVVLILERDRAYMGRFRVRFLQTCICTDFQCFLVVPFLAGFQQLFRYIFRHLVYIVIATILEIIFLSASILQFFYDVGTGSMNNNTGTHFCRFFLFYVLILSINHREFFLQVLPKFGRMFVSSYLCISTPISMESKKRPYAMPANMVQKVRTLGYNNGCQ